MMIKKFKHNHLKITNDVSREIKKIKKKTVKLLAMILRAQIATSTFSTIINHCKNLYLISIPKKTCSCKKYANGATK